MNSKVLKTCCGSDLPVREVSTIYKNKKFYFCDTPCLELFEKDPEKFMSTTHFRLNFDNLEDA